MFNYIEYINNNENLRFLDKTTALNHYIKIGRKNGLKCNTNKLDDFDYINYININKDIYDLNLSEYDSILHYVRYGKFLGYLYKKIDNDSLCLKYDISSSVDNEIHIPSCNEREITISSSKDNDFNVLKSCIINLIQDINTNNSLDESIINLKHSNINKNNSLDELIIKLKYSNINKKISSDIDSDDDYKI